MKTRKIMALLLMLTMITSALFMGGNASAAKKKPTYKAGTTYTAVRMVQKTGSLTAYMSGVNLYAKYGSKKAVKLTSFKPPTDEESDEYINGYNYIKNFFTDGRRVFYGISSGDKSGIYRYDAKTGKKKQLISKYSILLGGNKYGIVYYVTDEVGRRTLYYTDSKGVSAKIGKIRNDGTARSYDIAYFDGRIYYYTANGMVEYTVNTQKTVKIKGSSFKTTKKYLYYLDAKSNLIRMDKTGNKVKIDSDVNRIMGANNGKTVVYNKGDYYNKGTVDEYMIKNIYRATGKRVYKLTDELALVEDVNKIGKKTKLCHKYVDSYFGHTEVLLGAGAAVMGDNIYFTLGETEGLDDGVSCGGMIVKINKNGGSAKYVREYGPQEGLKSKLITVSALQTVGNTLYYCGVYTREPHQPGYERMTIK